MLEWIETVAPPFVNTTLGSCRRLVLPPSEKAPSRGPTAIPAAQSLCPRKRLPNLKIWFLNACNSPAGVLEHFFHSEETLVLTTLETSQALRS